MRQRWMRLSNSRKLWISTRRNYYQTEVLTFYVTENLPPTTAWQRARRVERALCRRDRARRRVGECHRARTDCGSAGGRAGRASPPILPKRLSPALRTDQGPDILQQHEQMHGIAGRRDEIEAFVEGPRLIILGVDCEGPKAGDLGRRERPGERVLQKTGPDPLAGPAAGDREAREDHQGNRMPGDALAQPLRCILIVHVPERQRVEADNLILRESQISLRAVGKLALQSEADQEAVQRFLAAIESLDGTIAPQLLDAERHLLRRRLLEHAGFGQKPLEPRQGPGRRIERSQKRLPTRRVEPKMLTIGQRLLSSVERALQHEFADRAPRSLRGGVQHPLRFWRQAQIEFLGSRSISHDDISWCPI